MAENRMSACILLPLCLLLAACGVKAFPAVPKAPALPEIRELKAQREGDVLHLTWSLSPSEEEQKKPEGFAVYRFRAEQAAEICETCPVPFERVAAVPFSPDKDEKPGYSETLLPGFRYLFKITALGEDGSMGPDSETLSFTFPDKQKQ